VRPALVLGVLGVLGACGSFQDPDLVVDLRILAMAAEPPDQLVTVDLESPPQPADILAQLEPAKVCVLVADPNFDRELAYTLTLCISNNSGRCSSRHPQKVLATGRLADPELTQTAPELCVDVPADGNLLGILVDALEDDVLHGLGGVDYIVELELGADDIDPSLNLFGEKTLRVVPNLPAGRTANTNPHIDRIDVTVDDAAPVPLALGRCVDQPAPLELAQGQKIRLTPVEPDGVRETYVAPTIDGQGETFTESLTYQWLAGSGGFSSGFTGGPRDFAGNPAPLFTDFKAPADDDVPASQRVPLWIVQRDERLGVAWYESCVQIAP
jgi:hypothetical protein